MLPNTQWMLKKEFNGVCHSRGCLEGLAAGPSLEARTGIRGENIELNSSVWDIQAYYIAKLLSMHCNLPPRCDCIWWRE